MKQINLIIVVIVLSIMVYSCKNEKPKKNMVNENEKAENWISLFNGVDLDGWKVKINGYPLDENIHNTFRVEDSLLIVSYEGYENFGEAYGHIFYEKPFSSYILKLQYRFVGQQPADGQEWAYKNSGVMIHSQSPESMGLDQGFPVSLEVQFLGGKNEGVARPTGNLCTPGTHVTMNEELVTDHCITADAPTFYGNEWVNVEVEVYRDSLIRHKINGEEVISYTKPVWGGEFLPESEVWETKKGKPVTEGYISLQSESHPIEFKNIRILELK